VLRCVAAMQVEMRLGDVGAKLEASARCADQTGMRDAGRPCPRDSYTSLSHDAATDRVLALLRDHVPH
jgi:hypothetical protein